MSWTKKINGVLSDSEAAVLNVIINDHGLKYSDIAEELDMHPGSVNNILTKLKNRGFVKTGYFPVPVAVANGSFCPICDSIGCDKDHDGRVEVIVSMCLSGGYWI